MANTRKLDANLDDIDETEEMEGDEAMFDQQVDFDSIKGTKVVEVGEYRLFNENVKLSLSRASKQPKLTIRIRIEGGNEDGTPVFQDFSWAEGARPRSKRAFVGMGLPENYSGTLREMAEDLTELEYYGIFDIEQSDGINERTQRPYDPRNRLVSTSQEPQTGNLI